MSRRQRVDVLLFAREIDVASTNAAGNLAIASPSGRSRIKRPSSATANY